MSSKEVSKVDAGGGIVTKADVKRIEWLAKTGLNYVPAKGTDEAWAKAHNAGCADRPDEVRVEAGGTALGIPETTIDAWEEQGIVERKGGGA